MAGWNLYMVRTRSGALYTGVTTDVARRFAEHQAGGTRCARYLRGRGPLQLVFQQELGSRAAALQAEHAVKKLPKAAKEALVANGGFADLGQTELAPSGKLPMPQEPG